MVANHIILSLLFKKGTFMGKSSKYPKYSNGSVSINGTPVAKVSKKGNSVSSNYYMNDAEKGIYDYSQESLLTALPQINIFDKATQNDINSQVNAYKNRALQEIQNTYNPMLENLKNDIASRFGNFNNSAFLDNLNTIEGNRALAMSDLAQDVETKRSELYDNELANRYNYLSFLNNLRNQINNNIMNYLNAAQSNSSSGNNYNQNAYNANSQNTDLFGTALNFASKKFM